MAHRPKRRSEWNLTKNGCWTRSLGDRGMRVRLFQKRRDGTFFCETHIPKKGRHQSPLKVRTKADAERLGKELLSKLVLGLDTHLPGPIKLGDLWSKYSAECQDYLDNRKHTKEADVSKARNLIGYFSADFDILSLSANDLAYYRARRKAGGIKCENGYITRAVRQNAVHADLALMRRMLRWACTVRLANGKRWLNQNPIDGLRFEKEKNPVRSVSSIERYQKTRETIQRLANESEDDQERLRWIKLELALLIAEGTGRRRGAIVGLRWEDFDFTKGAIHWRAEHDKKGKDSVIPMPLSFMEEMRKFQVRIGAFSGYLFPYLRNPQKPMPADMLTQWLAKAESEANLSKLPGSLWHAFRRKWASERMHLPLKAVADAGGWSDTATLLTCYQQTDEATLLAVMSEPNKRSDKRVG